MGTSSVYTYGQHPPQLWIFEQCGGRQTNVHSRNTSMLLITVIVWKNQTGMNKFGFPAQLQASRQPSR